MKEKAGMRMPRDGTARCNARLKKTMGNRWNNS